MPRLLRLVAVATVWIMVVPIGAAAAKSSRVPGRSAVDEYVVVLDRGNSPSPLANQVAASRVLGSARGVPSFVARLSEQQAAAMARHPHVAAVSKNTAVQPFGKSPNTTTAGSAWGIDRIDQRALPLSNSFNPITDGAGVRIYVLDSGINASHTEFAGRITPGYSVFNDGYGTSDCYGHGTHVAGIAAGTSMGVARKSTITPVKVLDCLGGSTVELIVQGMNWTAEHYLANGGPAVLNGSLGDSYGSAALDAGAEQLVDLGLTYVAAAGNTSGDACVVSPGRSSKVLNVGATASNDTMTAFSSYGACNDILAPGNQVKSAWVGSSTATSVKTGTSMAAPHVAGVAALFLQQRPASTPAEVEAAVVGQATTGVITGDLKGSPNKMLYSRLDEVMATVDLSASPLKVATSRNKSSVNIASLSWTAEYVGFPARVLRDGVQVASLTSGSSYTDNTGKRGALSITYQVCGPTGCTAKVLATWQ